MSRLLEILGRAITVDTADLIWHWFAESKPYQTQTDPAQLNNLDKIIELVDARRIETAEEQLRLYLFDNPECPRGRLAAAAICLQKNHISAALEELNSVYLRQPSNTMALYALGHCYERLGKEAQAVEFYQDCLKFKNYLQLPRQRLAAIYFKNGQFDKTTHEYELLKKEYPGDISTLVTLGYLYIANSRFPEAIETFNTAILIHPDNFQADDDDIDQLVLQGEFYQALEQIEELLEQHCDQAPLIAKRADILAMLGDTAGSISQYEHAIHLAPDFLEANIKLGTQYLSAHAHQLAAQQFNTAAEINDKIVDAYIGLAIAQNLDENHSDAQTTLSLAAAIQPNSPLLFTEAAKLQFQTGSIPDFEAPSEGNADLVDQVISAHRTQAAQHPQNPDVHYRLGILLTCVSRIGDAADAFRHALQINPTFTRARHKLALCLFDAGKTKAAFQQLLIPESLDKDTLALHYKIALLYCDKIKFASSLINLEHHMTENFTNADTTINVSIVLQNLGLLDRAYAMWENLSDTVRQAMNAD